MIPVADKSIGYLFSIEKDGPGSGIEGHRTAREVAAKLSPKQQALILEKLKGEKEKRGGVDKKKHVDDVIESLNNKDSQINLSQFQKGLCGNVATSFLKLLPGSTPHGLVAITEEGSKHLLHVIVKYQGKFIDAKGEVNTKQRLKEKSNASGGKIKGKIIKIVISPVSKEKVSGAGASIDWVAPKTKGSADSSYDSELHGYVKETLKLKTKSPDLSQQDINNFIENVLKHIKIKMNPIIKEMSKED